MDRCSMHQSRRHSRTRTPSPSHAFNIRTQKKYSRGLVRMRIHKLKLFSAYCMTVLINRVHMKLDMVALVALDDIEGKMGREMCQMVKTAKVRQKRIRLPLPYRGVAHPVERFFSAKWFWRRFGHPRSRGCFVSHGPLGRERDILEYRWRSSQLGQGKLSLLNDECLCSAILMHRTSIWLCMPESKSSIRSSLL
jgi:hypothetical protein